MGHRQTLLLCLVLLAVGLGVPALVWLAPWAPAPEHLRAERDQLLGRVEQLTRERDALLDQVDAGLQSEAPRRAAFPVGRRAPGFALPSSTGGFHDLGDYRGKVLLLDVMQTRCANCRELTKTLEKIETSYGDEVAILSIVVPPDNQTTVAAYISELGVTTPILFDCGQVAASYLKVSPQRPTIHVPHLFLIDKQGMIRRDFGHTETDVFEGKGLPEEIDSLLGDGS